MIFLISHHHLRQVELDTKIERFVAQQSTIHETYVDGIYIEAFIIARFGSETLPDILNEGQRWRYRYRDSWFPLNEHYGVILGGGTDNICSL